MSEQKEIVIGIDPGVNTGIAFYNLQEKKFFRIETMKIHKAIHEINVHKQSLHFHIVKVRFEDARQRKWFGNAVL